MAEKKLKLWNGRMSHPYEHGYVAAYSRADAIRVIAEALGYGARGMDSELKNYWHEGGWGNPMAGIVPERGLWASEKISREIVRIRNGKAEPIVSTPEREAFLKQQAEEIALLSEQMAERDRKRQELANLFNNLVTLQEGRHDLFSITFNEMSEAQIRQLAEWFTKQ